MTDDKTMTVDERIAEAVMHARSLCEFAYEQGFHELGYDPIGTLASRIQAQAEEVERERFVLDEWLQRTRWVQDTAKPSELGMHRADVLRQRIEQAEAEIERQMEERAREQQTARFRLEAANQRCDRVGAALTEAEAECARLRSWPNGVLNQNDTLRILIEFNAWRRGAPTEQPDARMAGLALDAAIAYIGGLRRDTALLSAEGGDA